MKPGGSSPYRALFPLPPLERPKPLTDHEFKSRILDLMEVHLGPIYVNPMVVARLRKVFNAAYDPALDQPFVGTLYGVQLYQTPDITNGWFYAPPGGDDAVLRGRPAERPYLHQIDPAAEPYTPPPPRLSRYERLRADE